MKQQNDDENIAAWNAMPESDKAILLRKALGLPAAYDPRSFDAGYKKACEEMARFLLEKGR
jgi:hypothetical protein